MPRIISGTAKKMKLSYPRSSAVIVRPTSDRVKESLFNIIADILPGSKVFDIFAGTGSLGVEALSRGACEAVFADNERQCCEVIIQNLTKAALIKKASVINKDASEAITEMRGRRFDIVFMDPPYGKKLIEKTMDNLLYSDIINEDGLIIAEHHIKDSPPAEDRRYLLTDRRRYGITVLSFYRLNNI